MDERILEQLKLLSRYVIFLNELSNVEKLSFSQDFKIRGSAERYLQLAIESCISVGNRILSLQQFKKPIKTPETYADIFVELGILGAIPTDFVETMIQMTRFRSRLVHLYWDIDPDYVYTIVQSHLTDFDSFKSNIIDDLNRELISTRHAR